MATRFHLGDLGHTDLVAMTLPTFFVNTPDLFSTSVSPGSPVPSIDRPCGSGCR